LAKLRRLLLTASASKKGVFMLRFSQAIVVSLLASSVLFACGDKINPKGDEPTPSGGAGTAGAGGNGGGGSTGTPTAITYSGTIKPFLDKYCTTCHASGGAYSPALDSYSLAKNSAPNSLADIQGTGAIAMPPSGSPQPTAAEKKLFQDWVDQGTLQ
jgi:cytochrome c5